MHDAANTAATMQDEKRAHEGLTTPSTRGSLDGSAHAMSHEIGVGYLQAWPPTPLAHSG